MGSKAETALLKIQRYSCALGVPLHSLLVMFYMLVIMFLPKCVVLFHHENVECFI